MACSGRQGIGEQWCTFFSASICYCQSTSQLKDFQIDVVNKAMIHSCRSYCLRRQSAKKGNDSDKSVEPSKVEETGGKEMSNEFWNL